MTGRNSILLYVTDAVASTEFYRRLLGQEPVAASPGFAMFVLPSGLGLGIWAKAGIQPAPVNEGGGSEIGFRAADAAQVAQWHEDWKARGATILLPPTDLDFGHCFVAADPDGHRLRVYLLGEG